MTKQELVEKLMKSEAFKSKEMTTAWVETFSFYNEISTLNADDFEITISEDNEVDIMLHGTTIETFFLN